MRSSRLAYRPVVSPLFSCQEGVALSHRICHCRTLPDNDNFVCQSLSLGLEVRHTVIDFHAFALGQNCDAVAVLLAEHVLRTVGVTQFE
jgi:hypothetical protein